MIFRVLGFSYMLIIVSLMTKNGPMSKMGPEREYLKVIPRSPTVFPLFL